MRVFTWPFALEIGRLPNERSRIINAIRFRLLRPTTASSSRSFCEGLVAQFEADAPKANASFSEARSRLKQKADEHPDDPWSLSYLGLADAFLGHKADAIAEGRHAVEILPVSKDALNGAFFPPNLAMIYAWTGEQDKAIDELVALIGKPSAPEYGELKLNPFWDPLRKDPRFEKLLAELAPRD